MSVRTRSLYLWKITSRLSSSHITPQLAEVLHRWPGGQIDLVSEGDVARLRFNRPDKNNCFSGEMMFQLGERVQDLDKVSSCGVLVVEGVGKSFCTGGDLGLIDEVSVARLHGHCLGGGTEIASSCDIRVAHKDTKIGFMQARLGIVPSWGAADYFASIVGRSTALRLMTTAAMISASEAKDIGFVDVVYESDDDFEEFISSMLKNGAEVCRAQKAMVRAVENGNEDEKLDVVRSVWGGPAQKNAIMKQMDALKQKK